MVKPFPPFQRGTKLLSLRRWGAVQRRYVVVMVLVGLGLLVNLPTLALPRFFLRRQVPKEELFAAIPVNAKYIFDSKDALPNWKFPADVAAHQVVIAMCDNRWHPPTGYLALSSALNKAYANYHGHRFLACDIDKDFTPQQVPPNLLVVGKLHCILKAMREMEDVRMVVYIDSDAILRNFTQTFTQFIQSNVIPPATPVPTEVLPPGMSLSSMDAFDVIVPTDCDDYQFNAGLQIWRNTPSAQQLLQLWIDYTFAHNRFQYWDHEQLSFRLLWEAPNSPTAYRTATIPHGPATWHIGTCTPKKSAYIHPSNFLPHITGRWPHARVPFMQEHIRELCLHKESPWALVGLPDCPELVHLLFLSGEE